MGVIESLGLLIKAHPQARLVAFADLSSSMILASQGSRSITQEHLDRLCKQARASFDDPLFALAMEAFSEPQAALMLGDGGVHVFMRSESEPADALCCICDHGIDLASFVEAVRETLAGISGS